MSFLSVMHGLMPPHPGPVVAIDKLHANMGMVLVWGFVIGSPDGSGRRAHLRAHRRRSSGSTPSRRPCPIAASSLRAAAFPASPSRSSPSSSPFSSCSSPPASAWDRSNGVPWTETPIGKIGLFVGNPTVALLTAVIFATWSLGTRCGYDRAQLLKFTEQSIFAIGMTLLVVGGGGGFARVLRDGGVANTLGTLAGYAHLSPLLYGWLISAFIRVSTGSATVSITGRASGPCVPVLAAHPETNAELLIIAIGCGSLFLSHLNDGGFWIVKDCLGLTVSQTLRTWSNTY